MGPLDSAAKAILHEVPEDIVGLTPALAGLCVREVKADDTVLSAFSLTMDKLLHIELEGEEEPFTLHVEVEANWASDVPREVFSYWSLTHRAYDNLWSVVICLKPGNKQGQPKSYYERTVRGRCAVRFEFDVVKVWELKADDLLAQGKPGLLALVPFADGTSEAHVDRAMHALEKVEPEKLRGELQAALAAFADNAFPDVDWSARIPEELLMGSTVYQRGEVAGQRKLLTVLLNKRLGDQSKPLIARLQFAVESSLIQVGELLAEQQTREELLKALDAQLPQAGKSDAE